MLLYNFTKKRSMFLSLFFIVFQIEYSINDQQYCQIYRGVLLGLFIACCINGKFNCYTCVVPLLVLVCHLQVIASCVICSVAYKACILLVTLVKKNLDVSSLLIFSYLPPKTLHLSSSWEKNTCSTSVPV